jgi:hypothetical protein
MGWDKNRRDDDVACRIKIEDSFVVIVCGEMDQDKLRDSYKTYIEIKENNQVVKND